MKPIYPFAFLGALLAVGAVNAATTDPVGYITHTVNTQSGAETLTILSPSLVRPDVFAGVSTVSPSGGSTITFASGVPTDLGTAHVLEIPSTGWWSTVISSTATSITINDPFPASLPANTAVSVRPHTTISSFLGANAPGLTPIGGANPADEVQILNSSQPGQPLSSYVYVPASVSGAPADGWFNLADSSAADDVIIEPGSAILIKCFQGSNLTFVSTGEVKTTPTQYDVFPGLNLVGTHSAAGSTLNGMEFNNTLIQLTGSNANFDELQILEPSQALSQYAAAAPGLLGDNSTVARLSDSSDAGANPFNEGTGAIIKRDAGNPASSITLPPSVVAD